MIKPSIKLIVIVGPTASGKTSLALDLAEKYHGEIVCADSRTIYRGMDIGTAKPNKAEQARVPHHLLDIVDPGERLSVAAFKALAEAAIEDIAVRGKVPFLVGGSGLYIDSLLYDYQFPAEADETRRKQLNAMTNEELLELLNAEDPLALERIDMANRRRVIRAIETSGEALTKRAAVRESTLVLGLGLNKESSQKNIEKRIEKMLEEGFIEEVRQIGSTYGWDSEALTGIGYRAFKGVVIGTKSVEAAKADFARSDLHLVKKQLTWFKRNSAIKWLDNPTDADDLVRTFVSS